MEARGFQFQPVEVEAERPWYLSLSPLEYARLAGFGVVEEVAPILYAEEDAQPDPYLRYMDSLEPVQRSLFQTSLGICQDEANETVFGPQNQLWLTLQPAVHGVRLAIEASPEYAAALLRWRECMKPLNLYFQEPDDVSAWLTNDFTRFVAREVESEQHPVRWTAVVSVSCCHFAGG